MPITQGGTNPVTQDVSWWVEIIYSYINVLQENYAKVVQSKTKPHTGSRLTYFVTGVEGPYKTKAEADKAAAGYSGIVNAKGVGHKYPPSALDNIGAFFSDLGKKSTWLRVGKVLLGTTLVIVGLVQLTHTQNIIEQTAKTASKAAIA